MDKERTDRTHFLRKGNIVRGKLVASAAAKKPWPGTIIIIIIICYSDNFLIGASTNAISVNAQFIFCEIHN